MIFVSKGEIYPTQWKSQKFRTFSPLNVNSNVFIATSEYILHCRSTLKGAHPEGKQHVESDLFVNSEARLVRKVQKKSVLTLC